MSPVCFRRKPYDPKQLFFFTLAAHKLLFCLQQAAVFSEWTQKTFCRWLTERKQIQLDASWGAEMNISLKTSYTVWWRSKYELKEGKNKEEKRCYQFHGNPTHYESSCCFAATCYKKKQPLALRASQVFLFQSTKTRGSRDVVVLVFSGSNFPPNLWLQVGTAGKPVQYLYPLLLPSQEEK